MIVNDAIILLFIFVFNLIRQCSRETVFKFRFWSLICEFLLGYIRPMMMIGHNVIITLLFIFVFNLIISDAGIPFQLSFDVNNETMDYLLIDSGYCCDGTHDSAQETLSLASYGNIEEVSPKIFSLYLASLVYHSFCALSHLYLNCVISFFFCLVDATIHTRNSFHSARG